MKERKHRQVVENPDESDCNHINLFGLNWYQDGKMEKISPLHCTNCGKTAKEMDAERKLPKRKRKHRHLYDVLGYGGFGMLSRAWFCKCGKKKP